MKDDKSVLLLGSSFRNSLIIVLCVVVGVVWCILDFYGYRLLILCSSGGVLFFVVCFSVIRILVILNRFMISGMKGMLFSNL